MTEKNINNINLLKKIYKWYYDIFLITLEYSQGEDKEYFREMLNKREEIFNFIKNAQQKFEEEKTEIDNITEKKILEDIKQITEKIAFLDEELKRKLINEIGLIKLELSSLYKREKALSAYSKQM